MHYCGNDCSLRQAIIEANANPGLDTITFAAVTNGVPIVLTIAPDATPDDNQDGDLDILVGGGDLTIQGNEAGVTIIDASGLAPNDRVFHVCPASLCALNVVFNGVTIQNGNASEGGGIYNLGTTTVDASTVSANTATTNGGGVYNNNNAVGATSVTGSCIVGNSASSFYNNQLPLQTATGNWWERPPAPTPPARIRPAAMLTRAASWPRQSWAARPAAPTYR